MVNGPMAAKWRPRFRLGWRYTQHYLKQPEGEALLPLGGPLGKLLVVVTLLQWEWVEPFVFSPPDGHPLGMVRHEEGFFLHSVREQLRRYVGATDRQMQDRQDMQGIGRRVAYEITTALLRSRRPKPKKTKQSITAAAVTPLEIPTVLDFGGTRPDVDKPFGLETQYTRGAAGDSPDRIWAYVQAVDGIAADAGIQAGDILLQANGRHPRQAAERGQTLVELRTKLLRNGCVCHRTELVQVETWGWRLAAGECPWAPNELEEEQVDGQQLVNHDHTLDSDEEEEASAPGSLGTGEPDAAPITSCPHTLSPSHRAYLRSMLTGSVFVGARLARIAGNPALAACPHCGEKKRQSTCLAPPGRAGVQNGSHIGSNTWSPLAVPRS